MPTFARVKPVGSHTRTLILAVIMLMSACFALAQEATTTPAGSDTASADAPDEMVVSLLTCSPGEASYALYGHTALRVQDLSSGSDWTFNYGVFNFRKPFFVLRFALGLTDYELGAVPMRVFLAEYERTGRGVTEQVLDLTPREKRRLLALLEENMQPENVVYRYNFFYDNCTTRARDIVARCLDGQLSYPEDNSLAGTDGSGEDAPSWRDLIHKYTAGHKWDAFGNDLCLGVAADRPTTWRERQFLPLQLMDDFDRTMVVREGDMRSLVSQRHTLMEPRMGGAEEARWLAGKLSPSLCASLLFCATFGVMVWERSRRKVAWAFDVLLMALQGIVGCAAMLLLFSQHPTTSTNLQALILNPLPLFFIHKVARRRPTRYWQVMGILGALMVVGGFVQGYAEGMEIVALCLLLRCSVHIGMGMNRGPVKLRRVK